MKTLAQLDRVLAKDDVPVPTKVCMHVLGPARTDPRVMREATALVEAGYEVSIVDIEPERSRPIEEVIQGVCLKHLIMPHRFVSTRFKPWFLVKLALIIIYSAVHLFQVRASIYHAHDEHALPACYIAARLRRKPLIFDAHELPLTDPSILRWRKLSALAIYFLGYMARRCAGVITTSPLYAQEIAKNYHIHLVTLVRNLSPYQVVAKSDRLRQELGLGSNVRIALYQGNLQANRELDKLVHAARFLEQDIVIVLMGQGLGDTRVQLEALIANQGVADRVKILPPVPYAELLEWTASADIGLIILPPHYSLSIKMCLPNKLFEYLMAGLPVISSQLDATVDVITTYDAGQVVSSLLPSDVAAVINSMLADPGGLARMRCNALEIARSKFHWEKESPQLVQLYQTILAGQQGR